MAEQVGGPVATRVLHCNFNTTDVDAALRFYVEGLGLTERMRSVSDSGFSEGLGMTEETHSVASFAYDHRGGRVAPAIELVEWTVPPTIGEAYATPSEVGMQAAGFAVPSVRDAVAACVAAGGTLVPAHVASADPAICVAAIVKDPDGVTVELLGDPDAPSGRFRSIRLVVADLDAAGAWYRSIGFRSVGGPVVGRYESDDPTWDGAVTIQRLVPGVLENVELHLTRWDDRGEQGPAHVAANSRGMFRMALGVDDVRQAVSLARPPVVPGTPELIPLPGTPLGGLWVTFMRDADGVMVEFVERPLDAPKAQG